MLHKDISIIPSAIKITTRLFKLSIVYFIIFQIGHGNVARNLEIPIFMILPRHFVCPTIHTNVFCVDFELNVNVVFDDNYVASENVALTLVR